MNKEVVIDNSVILHSSSDGDFDYDVFTFRYCYRCCKCTTHLVKMQQIWASFFPRDFRSSTKAKLLRNAFISHSRIINEYLSRIHKHIRSSGFFNTHKKHVIERKSEEKCYVVESFLLLDSTQLYPTTHRHSHKYFNTLWPDLIRIGILRSYWAEAFFSTLFSLKRLQLNLRGLVGAEFFQSPNPFLTSETFR